MPLPRTLAQRLRHWHWLALTRQSYVPLTSSDLDDRFSKAVVISIVVHLAFMFGLQFKAANPRLFENVTPPLDVVLVNAKSRTAPLTPEVLAQVNLEGGGDVDEDRQAKSPLPASARDASAAVEAMQSKVQALEAQAKEMLAQVAADFATPEKPAPRAPAHPPTPAPADLAARSLEMARLQARIDDDYESYQKRPRRVEYGARAREYVYARYVEDWRLKVERIGNLNYPEAARRDHIHGSLLLTVYINADGSVESLHVERSSGSKILDAAATRIVELSAPFAPFPEEIRKQADILGITRWWAFTTGDQLTSH